MDKNTKTLLRLVADNPDLPIVPVIDGDTCGHDGYSSYMGKLGRCWVDEYVIDEWYGDGRVLFRDEEEALIESIAEGKYNGTEEDYIRAEEEAKALWKKAIILSIVPEG